MNLGSLLPIQIICQKNECRVLVMKKGVISIKKREKVVCNGLWKCSILYTNCPKVYN